MKLTNIFPHIKTDDKAQINKADTGPTHEAKPAAKIIANTDRVELSANSINIQKAKEVLLTTPDVRTDKVQALKEQVERGEYKIDPMAVADKMLLSLISDTNIQQR